MGERIFWIEQVSEVKRNPSTMLPTTTLASFCHLYNCCRIWLAINFQIFILKNERLGNWENAYFGNTFTKSLNTMSI